MGTVPATHSLTTPTVNALADGLSKGEIVPSAWAANAKTTEALRPSRSVLSERRQTHVKSRRVKRCVTIL